ncbi:GNAT family N-acetyltransferase [Streptomyces sp. NPDC057702]|uniref:GNAT family N-acetyltransferase n=1 Tax=unclassified Streptomyces TaxID=2593676 RepID=UPI0036CE3194
MAEVFLRRLTRWQAEQQREAVADLYVTAYREPPGVGTADGANPAVTGPGAGLGGSTGTTPSGGGLGGRTGGGPAGGGLGGGLAGGGLAGGGLTGSGAGGGGLAGSGLADRAPAASGRHGRRAFLDLFADQVGQPGFDMIIASTPTLVGFAYGFQADRARVWHPGFQAGIPPEIDELTYSRPVFSVAELCVVPTRRRERIATRLMEQLLTRADGPLATATLDASNLPARRAFTSWGWARTGALLTPTPHPDEPEEPGREAWSHHLGR